MKLRQARKIVKRLRRVRYRTAIAATHRLNQRADRWNLNPAHVPLIINRRPTMTAEMLLRFDALAAEAWES